MRMNKKLAPLRLRNDVTHALQWNSHKRMNKKSRFDVVLTSYTCNRNLEEEIKNQEKINNSPSYRCAAIKKSKNLRGKSKMENRVKKEKNKTLN